MNYGLSISVAEPRRALQSRGISGLPAAHAARPDAYSFADLVELSRHSGQCEAEQGDDLHLSRLGGGFCASRREPRICGEFPSFVQPYPSAFDPAGVASCTLARFWV